MVLLKPAVGPALAWLRGDCVGDSLRLHVHAADGRTVRASHVHFAALSRLAPALKDQERKYQEHEYHLTVEADSSDVQSVLEFVHTGCITSNQPMMSPERLRCFDMLGIDLTKMPFQRIDPVSMSTVKVDLSSATTIKADPVLTESSEQPSATITGLEDEYKLDDEDMLLNSDFDDESGDFEIHDEDEDNESTGDLSSYDSETEEVKPVIAGPLPLPVIKHDLQCIQCGYLYSSKKGLREHLDYQGAYHNNQCNQCQLEVASYQLYSRHIEEDHGGIRKFNCGFCNKLFDVKTDVTKHRHAEHAHERHRRWSVGRGFCKICQKNLRRIRQHVLQSHPEMKDSIDDITEPCRNLSKEENDKELEQCPLCECYFPSVCDHLKTTKCLEKGASNKAGICYVCGIQYENVKQHITASHKEIHEQRASGSNRPETRKTVCEECGKAVKQIKYHMIAIHGKEGLKCPDCGKNFAKPELFRFHMNVHAKERPHKCNFCKKCFNTESNLNRHQKFHCSKNPDSTYCKTKSQGRGSWNPSLRDRTSTCDVCGKVFKGPSAHKIVLDHKIRRHTPESEKPFQCDLCDKGFSKRAHLRNHMNVHNDRRQYECSTCGKGFNTAGNRNAHERHVHLGIKHGQRIQRRPGNTRDMKNAAETPEERKVRFQAIVDQQKSANEEEGQAN